MGDFMAHIMVIGGGLSGSAAALELASEGQRVTLIEKSADIGGKVKEYGCKSAEKCLNCGVCLSGGLWEAVRNNPSISILTNTEIIDLIGKRGDFKAVLSGPPGLSTIDDLSDIVVATGFERPSDKSFSNIEADGANIISGYELERMLSKRNSLNIPFSSIAFLQCFGSRDISEKAMYCSRVCCAYAMRSARALKYIKPDLKITFFYMDQQFIEEGFYERMAAEGFEFIRSRPVSVKKGNPASVVFEDAAEKRLIERGYDIVVLSEGIHPASDTRRLSEILTLGTDERGFLREISDGELSGIYIAGCASGPKRIEEAYSEAITVSRRILDGISKRVSKGAVS